MNETVVPESYVGLLYEDGAYRRTLTPGKHKLKTRFFDEVERRVLLVDMRERSLTIKGQEILTSDKVAIRVSLLVYFRINDPVAASHNVSSYEERIYEDVQLSARRFLASRTLDQILTDRNGISDAVKQDVSDSATGYGVEVIRGDVKDLVFPGNLREIMNMVIETERRAEARIIEAQNEAEANRIREESKNQTQIARIQADKEMAVANAEAKLEQFRAELENRKEEAKALKENPELLKILQLETLQSLAVSGARISIGLDGANLRSATDFDSDK